jgi:hypothetical protein
MRHDPKSSGWSRFPAPGQHHFTASRFRGCQTDNGSHRRRPAGSARRPRPPSSRWRCLRVHLSCAIRNHKAHGLHGLRPWFARSKLQAITDRSRSQVRAKRVPFCRHERHRTVMSGVTIAKQPAPPWLGPPERSVTRLRWHAGRFGAGVTDRALAGLAGAHHQPTLSWPTILRPLCDASTAVPVGAATPTMTT